MNTPATVHIKKGEARALKAGGMWIYDNEIDRIEGSFENGDIITVADFDGYIRLHQHPLPPHGPHAVPEEGRGH